MKQIGETDLYWPVHLAIFLVIGLSIHADTTMRFAPLLFLAAALFEAVLFALALLREPVMRKAFKKFRAGEQLKGVHSLFYCLKYL